MDKLPRYAELPAAPNGGRSAWGVFGADDNIGTLNLLTDERVVAASRLIERGERFCLDVPFGAIAPALSTRRGVPRHTLLWTHNNAGFDDVYDNFFPQAASQWDSLAHVGYAPNAFYNGVTCDEIATGARNTMEHVVTHGIAGRGVLLDIERAFRSRGRDYNPGTTTPISVDDLELARADANVEIETGDIVLVRTGFDTWYPAQPAEARAVMPYNLTAAGLAHDESICEWLWDNHVAAICSDTYAVEVWPREEALGPFGFMHHLLIGQLGLTLGELWWLADLAEDCARDGRYTFFLASAPLHAPGAIGSPANAFAIK